MVSRLARRYDIKTIRPFAVQVQAGVVHPVELPSAIPAFLEACGKLAGEAVRRGDLARARAFIELAGCVVSANDLGRYVCPRRRW